MAHADKFFVEVRQAPLGLHQPPHLTTTGFTLSITPGGALFIEGHSGTHSFEAGHWESFEVKALTTEG
jgi:hypothetical protein